MKRTLAQAMAFIFLTFLVPAYAQDEERQDEEPIGVPVNSPPNASEDRDSRAARSFSNAIAWSGRNKFGFSLSAIEGRISSVFPNSTESNPSMLTAFSGDVFANLGRRKSQLHIDYGIGYRVYHQQRSMDGADHYGTISYSYQANRKVKFQLSDIVSSSLNDPFSSFSPILRTTIDWTPSPAYEVLFLPQRITRNEARAEVDFDFTRSTHVNVFGAYNNYWYGKQSFGQIDTVQTGASLDQRVTGWLSISSSYSTYLNNVDERYRDQQIHRLEIGRFHFMLSRHTEVFASGGVEVADTQGKYRTQGMYRAGISRSSERNVIYANYQRTMTSALGYSRVLPSDMVTLGVGQRLTDRTSLRFSSSYQRSTDFDYSGRLDGLYGRAQFEYALLSNLFASLNYTFQHQRNTIGIFSDMPHLNRSIVYFRLQYAWPSIRLRSE